MSYSMTAGPFGETNEEALAKLPEPCNSPDKLRALFEKTGVETAVPEDPFEKKLAAMEQVARWCRENEVDCRDDLAVCNALLKDTSNGWWSKQSTGVKIAIGVGGVAMVGGVAYLALK